MPSRSALAAFASVLLLASACAQGASDVSDNSAHVTPIDVGCVPNEVVYCPCPSGGEGEHRCNADGSGFGACECVGDGDALPLGWVCAPERFMDGACDCNCGADDPECFPGTCGPDDVPSTGGVGGSGGSGGTSSGGAANSGGSSGGGSGGSSGVGGSGGTSSGGPAGWTCDPTWYGDGQYCDCNCGLADPDCSPSQCSTGSSTACAHSACAEGSALGLWCSPCSAAVCALDSYCCNTSWDAQCVLQAQLLCSC